MDSGNVDTHNGDTLHKDNFDTACGLRNKSLWLATSPSKRWGELFFLAYSPFWITILLGVIVPLRLYEDNFIRRSAFHLLGTILVNNESLLVADYLERFQEVEYLLLGLLTAAPCIVFPFFLVCTEDAKKPFYRRYWFKANLWVGIFGYVGNYFWTHYFYVVLGATYTFPSYKINHNKSKWGSNKLVIAVHNEGASLVETDVVPITTFLLTQPYFLLYHTISNMTLRRLGHAIRNVPGRRTRWLIQAVWIVVLSYITALTESVTISNFPYYEMVDRMAMYKIGSLFYACYFFVSFPMFMRVDENVSAPWTLTQVTVDALGASMLVTIILDLWRITLGPIVDIPWAASHNACIHFGPPWLRSMSEVQGVKHSSWARPAMEDASCEDLSASTRGESYCSDEL